MQANLQQLLEEGQTGRHEPPFDPDPDDYVSWDYASGYADGVAAHAEQDEPSGRHGSGGRHARERPRAPPVPSRRAGHGASRGVSERAHRLGRHGPLGAEDRDVRS